MYIVGNGELPAQCTPVSPFLARLSIYFGTCIPTHLAFISSLFGTLSILSWLWAQMPQIYKNYQIQSTAGLSIFFLSEWLLGDLTNLLGCLFTGQAQWQVIIATYYTFVDICLVCQFFWYSHIKPIIVGTSLHSVGSGSGSDSGSEIINTLSPINSSFVEETAATQDSYFHTETTPDRDAKRTPQFRQVSYEKIPSDAKGMLNWTGGPSPRTVVVGTMASLAGSARALPVPAMAIVINTTTSGTDLEVLGQVISWCSTLLYTGSRLPQLYKNWSRKSTAGLSPLLFFAAFCGNLFYSTSLLTNPCAWNDFDPYGGHGWAGPEGSDRADWVIRAVPFFLGAAGVLVMDAMMGIQFLLYSEREEELVRVRDSHGHSRWERVNGWMRGWVPHLSSKARVVDLAESQRLLAESREIERFSRHYDGVRTW